MQIAESQLLAAWMRGDNTEHIQEFDHFTYYPEIFNAVSKAKKKSDLLELSKLSGKLVAELAELMEGYIPSAYDGYYRVMKETKIRAMLENAVASKSDLPERMEAVLKEMDSLQSIKIKPPTDLCEAYRKELEKRKKTEPLRYGFPSLDYITGGIRRQELTTVSARPGIGKTAFAWQVAVSLALRKHRVQFYPLEMAGFQLMERLVCRETNLKGEKLKAPAKMDEKDIGMLNYFFELYGMTIRDYLDVVEGVRTLAEIKRHIEHGKPELVVIDQLTQLRENRRFNSIREQFSYMTNTLKAMTMELDVPIMLLAQINRNGDGKEPTLGDLKESGSIEEDSDNVIMLHQTDEQIGPITPVTMIVRKQRNGAKDVKIECVYQNEKYIFREKKNT